MPGMCGELNVSPIGENRLECQDKNSASIMESYHCNRGKAKLIVSILLLSAQRLFATAAQRSLLLPNWRDKEKDSRCDELRSATSQLEHGMRTRSLRVLRCFFGTQTRTSAMSKTAMK